jgi:hypothetical protein
VIAGGSLGVLFVGTFIFAAVDLMVAPGCVLRLWHLGSANDRGHRAFVIRKIEVTGIYQQLIETVVPESADSARPIPWSVPRQTIPDETPTDRSCRRGHSSAPAKSVPKVIRDLERSTLLQLLPGQMVRRQGLEPRTR